MSERLAEFFRQASFYRYHHRFQKDEREYKIQLHNSLAASRDLLNAGSSKWLPALEEAIKSEDDNIIYWEYKNAFLKWLEKEPSQAFEAVGELWIKGANRFSSFSHSLAKMGLTRPGAQLEITSTLLLALSPNDHPPVKVDSFSRAMKIAGWDGLYRTNDPAKRYSLAQAFMDAMIVECQKFNVELRDRLDVQGVVWCVSGGWPRVPLPADWVNDPAQRAAADEWEYIKELRDIEKDPNTKGLPQTEKLVLAKARVGQGKFREALVRYWSTCAVTRCSNLNLLTASHIKPWKYSDRRERLDPFNGLLLSANLDLAFDKGLITFDDSGRIKISKQLSAHDRQVLGIHSGLRLSKVSSQHMPYLEDHRNRVFEVISTE